MNTDAITRDILINASAQTVYDVVSRPEHIAKWFSDEADLEPLPEARGILTWRDRETNRTDTVELTVVTADPPHVFAFSWVAPERRRETPDATDAVLVEFRITVEAGGTRLVVSESGLDSVAWDEAAKAAYAADHTNGWTGLLPKLRDYAEGLVAQDSA